MRSLDIEITAGSVRALPVPVTTENDVVIQGGCWLYGWSLTENTGAAAAFIDITSGGNTVSVVALAAGGTDTQWLGPMGIRVEGGITVSAISGAFWGAVFVGIEL